MRRTSRLSTYYARRHRTPASHARTERRGGAPESGRHVHQGEPRPNCLGLSRIHVVRQRTPSFCEADSCCGTALPPSPRDPAGRSPFFSPAPFFVLVDPDISDPPPPFYSTCCPLPSLHSVWTAAAATVNTAKPSHHHPAPPRPLPVSTSYPTNTNKSASLLRAYPWYTSVRKTLEDPAYADWCSWLRLDYDCFLSAFCAMGPPNQCALSFFLSCQCQSCVIKVHFTVTHIEHHDQLHQPPPPHSPTAPPTPHHRTLPSTPLPLSRQVRRFRLRRPLHLEAV